MLYYSYLVTVDIPSIDGAYRTSETITRPSRLCAMEAAYTSFWPNLNIEIVSCERQGDWVVGGGEVETFVPDVYEWQRAVFSPRADAVPAHEHSPYVRAECCTFVQEYQGYVIRLIDGQAVETPFRMLSHSRARAERIGILEFGGARLCEMKPTGKWYFLSEKFYDSEFEPHRLDEE